MHQPHPESATRTRDLDALPLFGQGLVATRLARRAVLAMLSDRDRDVALAACDALEAVARRGDGWTAAQGVCERARRLRRANESEAAIEGVRWANDSMGAAQGALDFPVDATVTASARRCWDAIAGDPRVCVIQMAIVMESDIDLIAFACRESNVHTYDGLGGHVFGRLAPCHPLALQQPRRRIEEEFR